MLLYSVKRFVGLFGFYFCAVVGSHAHSESYWLKILLHIAKWDTAFMFCLNCHKDDNCIVSCTQSQTFSEMF